MFYIMTIFKLISISHSLHDKKDSTLVYNGAKGTFDIIFLYTTRRGVALSKTSAFQDARVYLSDPWSAAQSWFCAYLI